MKELVLALAICLPGSASVWADGTNPPPVLTLTNTPMSVRTDGTNAPPVLTLTNAQVIALQNHPQIAAANYRALAAKQALKQTQSAFFPSVNLYATAVGAGSEDARILAGALNNPSIFDRAASGLSLSQLVTDFGRTANLSASSKFQAQAENQNAVTTREQVLLQVDISYYHALATLALQRVAQQVLDTRQLVLDQVNAKATNKLRSQLDVSFAQVEVQQARLLLLKSQNDMDAAMATLSTALGYREFHEFKLVEESLPVGQFTNDVSGLIQTALSQRPELLSLRYSRDAAKRLARAERAARLPTVEVVGTAGASPVHDVHLPDNYAAAGIQLSEPLFAGGFYTARQREAELRAQAEDDMLRAAEDNVIRDVRIAWLGVNNALEQLRTTEELVRNATEAYVLAQARYDNGISSIVELSQAQLNLTSAQIENANARYAVLIQQANLDYQTGMIH
jgi:outer membrane protein